MNTGKYNNAVFDWFVSDKKHEEEMAKLDALNQIANKSTQSSSLIYIIPIVGMVVGLVIVAIALKKKKQ